MLHPPHHRLLHHRLPHRPLVMMPLATLLAYGLGQPVLAHQTEIAQDIGATLHIEPNDIPRAGDENLAWFALARRGGESVPLEACDCRLTLYALPEMTPLSEPSLEPISAEGYENIPGATVAFPQIGAYELVLTGTPTTEGDFQPFEFRFEVTVATSATPTTATPTTATDTTAIDTTATDATATNTERAEDASPSEMRDEGSADNAAETGEPVPGESMATESDAQPLATSAATTLPLALFGGLALILLVLLGGGLLGRMRRNTSSSD